MCVFVRVEWNESEMETEAQRIGRFEDIRRTLRTRKVRFDHTPHISQRSSFVNPKYELDSE